MKVNRFMPRSWRGHKRPGLFIKLSLVLIFISLIKLHANNPAIAKNSWASTTSMQQIVVSGKILELSGDPIIGVNVKVEGTSIGAVSDINGKYSITVPSAQSTLIFSFIGYVTQKIVVGNVKVIDVNLAPDATQLEDVTVVAFAKQKKSSVMASITTIKPSELKVPSSNLTTALAGRMAGIIAYQRSGEPGKDNAQFFIRGVMTNGYNKSPLILIDGIELTTEDLVRMQPDDIASFSIMKDAAATALYGARGANGVVYVTTKEGVEGPAKFSVRLENSTSMATQKIKLADPITYMKLHNEAVRTRLGRNADGNLIYTEPLPYSQEKIDKTIAGVDPNLYPTTDWYKTLFNDQTQSQRLNFNVGGGGKIARYYIAGTLNNNNGNLKADPKNNFDNNINIKQFQLTSKVNINLTSTTKVMFNFKTSIDNYTGPLDGGADIYAKVMETNPVLFKPYYEPDEANLFTKHILYGNETKGSGYYLNPYSDMVKGYKESKEARVLAQIEINQDLSSLLNGLSFKLTANGNQYSYFDIQRQSLPYFYKPVINSETNAYSLLELNPTGGTDYLGYAEGTKNVSTAYYAEGLLNYTKNINKVHQFGAMLVGVLRDELKGNAGSLQKSLPYRNVGLSGRFTYGYADKYFFEGNFGYNGSERFSKNHRFGFFPSGGLGYLVSNESFFEPLKRSITKLKFKGTYGLVGNDAIGGPDDRFFYLSQVNMNDGSKSAEFGKFFNNSLTGVSISRYANDQISWETSKKLNVGVELGLFDKIELLVDLFHETRTNILNDRVVLATMGLQSGVRANIGEAKGQGIDASLKFNTTIGKDWWIQSLCNFTYAENKVTKAEEPDFTETPWRSSIGRPLSQKWGYIAERLFTDESEVSNSPEQAFGLKPMGGDIKYRDINGDGKITPVDMVPIGLPTDPQITYGFGFSLGYKTFDFSAFFQGIARESFWIDAVKTAPFLDYHDPNKAYDGIHNTQLLEAWANSYWSEDNRNPYAMWPRLSTSYSPNNAQNSTWFMRNGTFLRVKSMEVGYSIPEKLIRKVKMTKCRIYASGTNLFTFSKFKLWDPEMGGDGLGYPIQKVINLGVSIDF